MGKNQRIGRNSPASVELVVAVGSLVDAQLLLRVAAESVEA